MDKILDKILQNSLDCYYGLRSGVWFRLHASWSKHLQWERPSNIVSRCRSSRCRNFFFKKRLDLKWARLYCIVMLIRASKNLSDDTWKVIPTSYWNNQRQIFRVESVWKQNTLLLQGGREVNREGERNYKESMSTLSPDGCKTIEESATDVTSLTANDYLCDQYTTHDMDLYTLVSLWILTGS